MAGEELTIGQRKEIARLRHLLIQAKPVYVVTAGERRWLTDHYVMLDVTGSPALHDVSDGEYALSASKGFVPTKSAVSLNTSAFLARVQGWPNDQWYPVIPTHWTVTEHPAKAMLVYVDVYGLRVPLGLNEEAWRAFHGTYDREAEDSRAVFEHTGETWTPRPFRIRQECAGTSVTLGYLQAVDLAGMLDGEDERAVILRSAQMIVNVV